MLSPYRTGPHFWQLAFPRNDARRIPCGCAGNNICMEISLENYIYFPDLLIICTIFRSCPNILWFRFIWESEKKKCDSQILNIFFHRMRNKSLILNSVPAITWEQCCVQILTLKTWEWLTHNVQGKWNTKTKAAFMWIGKSIAIFNPDFREQDHNLYTAP